MTDEFRNRRAKAFYENVDRDCTYAPDENAIQHPFYGLLAAFIDKWNLRHKKCLEIGSAKGLFQDLVVDYTGVDVASGLSSYYHKPFIVVADARLPFADETFDAVFSYATYEHIPDIETGFNELVRVMKPGGICLLAPAWHTRAWFAGGYSVRPYSSLSFGQKLIKASIPFRDNPLIRYPFVILRRLARLGMHCVSGQRPTALQYRKLNANYEKYWQSDSDACNSLDPFDVILWFRSRRFVCHGHTNLAKCVLVRTYALELQKPLR